MRLRLDVWVFGCFGVWAMRWMTHILAKRPGLFRPIITSHPLTPPHPHTSKLLFLLAVVLAPLAATAQPFEQAVAPFPVIGSDGRPYDHPFLGGFNIPRPQFVDIDADGDVDLFVQERVDELIYFENTGTPQAPVFVWRTDAWAGLAVGEWSRFADMDGDGDLDLYAEQPFSLLRYFRNVGTPQAPQFVLAADTLRDTAGAFIFSDRQNIPALADLDCDNDLDLFVGSLSGTLTFYENQGLGPNAVPTFAFVTDRYENLEIVGGTAGEKADNVLHGANALDFADVDEDGDDDLIWGDFFSPSLYFIENTGTCGAPTLHLQSDTFPLTDPLMTSGYNAPVFADLDGDDDLDLFVGVLGGAFGAAQNLVDNFHFMERVDEGHTLRTQRFIGQIDVGDEGLAALGDLDSDGDLDLLVGNKINPVAPQRASLTFFENTGTPEQPAFQLVNTDYLDLGTAFNAAPALADVDADGDLDLLVGGFNGAVAYYRNDGTPQAPAFVLGEPRLVSLRDTGSSGSLATPTLADLDADGDFDLLVGENAGTVNHFRNDGTPQAPQFTLVTEAVAGLDLGSRTVPTPVDWDRDGDMDLLVGTERDGLVLLRNDGTPQAPAFVQAEAEVPSTSATLLAPHMADIDADGDGDLLLGTRGGGLRYYENLQIDTAVGERPELSHQEVALLPAYPNPFRTTTTLRFRLEKAEGVTVTVYDVRGRVVRRLLDARLPPGEHHVAFDAEALPTGIYFYAVTTRQDTRATGQVLRLR